jgi:hypothetical protein
VLVGLPLLWGPLPPLPLLLLPPGLEAREEEDGGGAPKARLITSHLQGQDTTSGRAGDVHQDQQDEPACGLLGTYQIKVHSMLCCKYNLHVWLAGTRGSSRTGR